MNQRSTFKRWAFFAVRWGIAVGDILWVLLNLSFHDRVMLLNPKTLEPFHAQVVGRAHETDAAVTVRYRLPDGQKPFEQSVPQNELWVRPDLRYADVRGSDGQIRKMELLAAQPSPGGEDRAARAVVAKDRATGERMRINPAWVVGPVPLTLSSPLIEIGVLRLVRESDPTFLLAAVFILPLNYLLTSLRWNILLRAVDIRLGQFRTFVLNMVGAFYNSFMPGTTGGDLVKAYYASKHTEHRTRAVMSVIVDRGIGLFALIVIGGAMAAYQWDIPDCRRVAKASAVLIGLVLVGATVFYTPLLRRFSGLDLVLRRLPMQKFVQKIVHALEFYGHRPLLTLSALVLAFPVHFAGIMSATFAGRAFGLKLDDLYYWCVVPVITLVGAIPISPQGAGVMEYFAVELTKRHGVTVGQAFALTISIRLVQMVWNLMGGLFLLQGGYRAPTEREQEELEKAEDDMADATERPAMPSPLAPTPLTAG